MNESNVVELKAPAGDALSELLKEGTRQLSAATISHIKKCREAE